MQYVRIEANVVVELVPPYVYEPSIAYWFNQAYADQCVEAPDNVVEGMIYNPKTKTFLNPEDAEKIPTNEELADENKILRAQLQFQTEHAQMLEGCIVELAAMVYPDA